MTNKACLVESCAEITYKGRDFCEPHRVRILKASEAAGNGPDWLKKMSELVSEEEVAAYSQVLTRMMQADASAVKAFGQPMHISSGEWDERAAEGWKTTDQDEEEE